MGCSVGKIRKTLIVHPALLRNDTRVSMGQVVTGDNARGGRGAVGVYTKTVTPPSCPIPGSRSILTVDQGVHRHGIFKVGPERNPLR